MKKKQAEVWCTVQLQARIHFILFLIWCCHVSILFYWTQQHVSIPLRAGDCVRTALAGGGAGWWWWGVLKLTGSGNWVSNQYQLNIHPLAVAYILNLQNTM
jgi:hypothetical protein